MRKITEDVANALLNGENIKRHNDRVENGCMFLFGNEIARFDGSTLKISDGGYTLTTTTKERLNGLLHMYGSNVRVFTKNFTPMISRSPIDKGAEWSGDWTVVQ